MLNWGLFSLLSEPLYLAGTHGEHCCYQQIKTRTTNAGLTEQKLKDYVKVVKVQLTIPHLKTENFKASNFQQVTYCSE